MSTPPPPGSPPPSPYAPPAAGGQPAPPGAGTGPRLPWEERDRLGIVEALFETVRLLVMEPSEAFSRLRRDGDLTSPILFGILLSWASMLVSQIWSLLFSNAYRSFFEGIEGLEGAFAAPSVGAIVGILLVWPVLFVVMLFLFGGILHLMLMLVKATDRSPTGFEGTIKVYAYSQVAGLANALPVFGGFVYGLWALVLIVIGYAIVHDTSQGRALVAVVLLFGLCCLCSFVAAAFFGAMIAAMFSGLAAQ